MAHNEIIVDGVVYVPLGSLRSVDLFQIAERLDRIEKILSALSTGQIQKEYMSPAEAAVRYSIDRSTVYNIVALPYAPATLKIGSARRLPVAEYDNFMKSHFGFDAEKNFRPSR